MTSEIDGLRTQIRHLKWGLYVLAVSFMLVCSWLEMKTDDMDLRLRGFFPAPQEDAPDKSESETEVIPLRKWTEFL